MIKYSDIKTYESVQSMPILITSASLNNDNNDDDDDKWYDGEEKLSYFMQITEITNESFVVRLDTENIDHTKVTKYAIKDVVNLDEEELDEISITKKKIIWNCRNIF